MVPLCLTLVQTLREHLENTFFMGLPTPLTYSIIGEFPVYSPTTDPADIISTPSVLQRDYTLRAYAIVYNGLGISSDSVNRVPLELHSTHNMYECLKSPSSVVQYSRSHASSLATQAIIIFCK